MSPTPTGEVRRTTGGGRDLVLTRELPGSLENTWASVTEPERTARWSVPCARRKSTSRLWSSRPRHVPHHWHPSVSRRSQLAPHQGSAGQS